MSEDGKLDYLQKDYSTGQLNLKHSHKYYSQIQTQLAVTGREWCDLFVYTRHGHFIERIFVDEEHWAELCHAAEYMFCNYFAKSLVDEAHNQLNVNTSEHCMPES